MIKKEPRFLNWKYPEIKEGIPTKFNWIVQNLEGLKLERNTDIGAYSYINAKFGVHIEENVQIGSHCSIYSISTIDNTSGRVHLERNCRIGSHSVILPGVTVSQNSIIGAHSLINCDIPPNVVAFGIPAKIHKNLNE